MQGVWPVMDDAIFQLFSRRPTPLDQKLVGYDPRVRATIFKARGTVELARRTKPLLDRAWDTLPT